MINAAVSNLHIIYTNHIINFCLLDILYIRYYLILGICEYDGYKKIRAKNTRIKERFEIKTRQYTGNEHRNFKIVFIYSNS